MRDRTFIGLVSLAVGALSVGGCGAGFSVTPVEGVVRLDGKPLVGVEVRFAPVCDPSEFSLPFSRALTDANGHYELVCDNKKPGAVVGAHTVVVRRPSRRPDPGEPPPPPPKPPIPAVYQSFGSTPIRIEIKIDNTVYDLNLKSAAK